MAATSFPGLPGFPSVPDEVASCSLPPEPEKATVGAGLTVRTASAPGMKIRWPTTMKAGSLIRLTSHTFCMFAR
jgi:hypothetical protein